MATKTIPELTAATVLAGTDLFEIAEVSGMTYVSKKVDLNQILTFMEENINELENLTVAENFLVADAIEVFGLAGSDIIHIHPNRDGNAPYLYFNNAGEIGLWNGASENWSIGLTGSAFFQNLSVNKDDSGNTIISEVSNLSNTASSDARFNASVAGTSGGDPYTSYVIIGGTTWSIGGDNSDSDALVISKALGLGSSNVLRIDASTSELSLPAGNFLMSRAASGAAVSHSVINTSNTASSTASYLAQVAGDTAHDVYYSAVINTVAAFSWGLDNSDSNVFKICATTNLGSADAFTISPSTLFVNIPGGNFGVTRSLSGSIVSTTVSNTSNTSSSDALFQVSVAGGSAGTASVQWSVTGVQTWYEGIDNVDADALIIGRGTALNVNRSIRLDTLGYVNFPGQPLFYAVRSTDVENVTGNGTEYTVAGYTTERVDVATNFNPTTGIFTAPRALNGVFVGGIAYSGATAAATGGFVALKSGSTYYGAKRINPGVLNFDGVVTSAVIPLAASATVQVVFQVDGEAGDVVDLDGDASIDQVFFGGYMAT